MFKFGLLSKREKSLEWPSFKHGDVGIFRICTQMKKVSNGPIFLNGQIVYNGEMDYWTIGNMDTWTNEQID